MTKAQEFPAPYYLVYDLNRDTLTGPLGRGANQNTDLFGNAALTTDHLSQILGCYAQLQNGLTFALSFGHNNLFGMFDQILGDIGQKLFHCVQTLQPYRAPAFFSRSRTVSVG